MKNFKITRKILALLLSLSLITGMMPAMAWDAFAAEEKPVDAAIIFTDLHTNKSTDKQSTIEAFFGNLRTTNLPFSSVTSGGDAFSVNSDNDGTKYDGYTDTISGYIRGEKALNDSDIPINYVWSDHDRYAYNNATEKTPLDKTSHVVYGAGADGVLGTGDDGNYYVYALSMGDMSTDDRYSAGFVNNRTSKGFTTTVDQAIDNFEADAALMKKDRPLFIVSHQPLLARRGDNGHAAKWCEAINTVASYMDVAFFFGHNHKHDLASDYYYAKGDNLQVAQKNGDKTGTSTKINFTHMCAGYMDPSTTGSTSGTTRGGTVVVAKIFSNKIQYVTYDNKGVYTGNFAVNETVTRAFATTSTTKELANITITTPPTKTTYFVGDDLDTTGMVVTATYSDNSTSKVTNYTVSEVNMSTEGTKTVTVTYTEGSVTKAATFNIVVETTDTPVVPDGNDYPEYPDEGAVKVNKTATGVDFQSSGLAQVEVSASGVPVKKGADLIIMLDTSSSMTKNTVTGTSKKRSAVLEESLANLITQLKTPGEDGESLDINVAIADFNGYYGHNSGGTSGTPYDRTAGDYVKNGTSDGSGYRQASQARVYTGSKSLDANAFVPANSLDNTYTLNYTSGTNYDYAFDAIYQLGTAIKNANKEERDLYVIFMSDGASLQWNYFGTENTYTKWNNWLTGAWNADDLTTSNLNSTAHSYFYDLNDHDNDGHINEHRMANAIKGSPDQSYEIIRKSTAGLPEGTLTKVEGKEYMYTVHGLGATMFTINFDAKQDGQITVDSIDKALQSTASDQTGTTQYYYKVTTADALSHAFDAIGSEIAYAATNARYVDQMGDNFNLQMATSKYSVVEGSSVKEKTLAPKIEIIQYDIYTRQDYLDNKCTESQIGDRKGTYKVLETVTFNEKGTEAYSDKINNGQTNILADGTQAGYVKGVIYAKTFLYNTNATAVTVDGVNIPTGIKTDGTTTGSTDVLPSETFYWKMGTVQTSELAMRYYVYLEGSMEGTREGGSYPTNEYANLYYDNYLGNPCHKDTTSPVMAWKEANVSYAFYLVDEDGNIIVNQTTGQTGSFANKIAVTNPVVYETVKLNNDEEVSSIDIASLNVLPEGYTLYDKEGETGATYTVTINSNTTGSWNITSVKDVATTYVTQYDPNDASAYSNDLTNSTVGDDYTHTVVWFAVLWKVQALPDAVVVDYGLPVDISVLKNDMFGDNGKLTGVGAYSDGSGEQPATNLTGHDPAMASGFGTNYTGTYGTAKADTTTGKVRYTLNKEKGMQMQTYEKFAYAVNYTGNTNSGYYYDTVTVIPATSIYYEDDFVALDSFTWNNEWQAVDANDDKYVWSTAGKTIDGIQGEDRPGKYSLTDANNIYGYDSVNNGMSTYSMGSASKATVDYDNKGTATFEFYGTGFDVIAMTSNTTGNIYVDVYDENNNLVKSYTVDTYYGYNRELYNVTYKYETVNVDTEDGVKSQNQWVQYLGEKAADDAKESKATKPENPEVGTETTGVEYVWVVNQSAENSIYQVPVMQIENLTYGKYKAVITASYNSRYDHIDGSNSYEFYLDAIRIYDPANDGLTDGTADKTIEDAYKADGEGWPSYIELRDNLIEAKTLGNKDSSTVVNGLVFIDGDTEVGDAQIEDYASYGPNNEVYLAPGQKVAFILNKPANIDQVHLGIKSANGEAGTYTIKNIAKVTNGETGVEAGKSYGEKTVTVNTTTDMYYNITGYKNDIIVISNTGKTGIISLTNIKSTYTSDPNSTATANASGPSRAVPAATGETTIYMTPAAAALTLKSLNTPVAPEEPETPDTPVVPDTPVTPEEPETPPVVDEPEEPVVTPAKIISVKTDKKTYVQGDKVKVTVTTNSATTKVKVGTKTLKTFKAKNGNRTWTTTVKASKIGKLSISAVAYNSKGTATKKVTKTVTVKKFAPKIFNVSLNKTKVKVGAKYTVTVKAGSTVKHIRVNGKKITKFTTKNGVKTFKVTLKATKVGKQKVKVVAYNKALYPTNPKFKTVTVVKR